MCLRQSLQLNPIESSGIFIYTESTHRSRSMQKSGTPDVSRFHLVGKRIMAIVKNVFPKSVLFLLLLGACAGLPDLGIVDNLERAQIPAGEFLMGSEDGNPDERPVHKVYLDEYYIDVYEVTNGEYAECVSAGACTEPHEKSSQTRAKYYGQPEFMDYPVIYVDWAQARAFCQWRGGDLPTEAQWEKAARGGLEGKTYAWGDTFEGTEANFCDANCTIYANADKTYDDGFPDTSPVGSFRPNGYGLYDMAGNVEEIVSDYHSTSYYSTSPYKNPTGPESGTTGIGRGGSWWTDPDGLRVSFRETGSPDSWYSDGGIRCAYAP